LIAQYGSLESTRKAIQSLRGAGFEAMGIHSSPVRRWALIGGITGCTLGFLLPAGASLAYPMVTQGKPIVAIPVFIVIMFELTVLLTGIFSLFSMLVHARKPKLSLPSTYRREFSVDRWGIFVATGTALRSEAERVVGETGPVSVEVTS
jgi:hypothetical protein